MGFLKDKDKAVVSRKFSEMEHLVKIVLFTELGGCQFCAETQQLLMEVEELSEFITVEIKYLSAAEDEAKQYGVDKAPAMVFLYDDRSDTRIRMFGIPSGYEFSTLLEDILAVSSHSTEFTELQKARIAEVNVPVRIRCFITPTCPYCPSAVRMAHRLAMENPNIMGEMIEAQEFPELSQKYNVRGVPRTVINDSTFFEGALPEDLYIDKLLEAIRQ